MCDGHRGFAAVQAAYHRTRGAAGRFALDDLPVVTADAFLGADRHVSGLARKQRAGDRRVGATELDAGIGRTDRLDLFVHASGLAPRDTSASFVNQS